MVTHDTYYAICDLLARYGNSLDDNKLDEWVEYFDEGSRYRILSRENYERKLPLALLQLDSKNMMRDRILSLREANVTNVHRDQHVTGLPSITPTGESTFNVSSGYAMYSTNVEGRSTLFSVGCYKDKVRVTDGTAKFIERLVIVDTFAIPNMLSTPI
jgi:3-phenylpropionate/cinnamic acid dioxygenase small subunit